MFDIPGAAQPGYDVRSMREATIHSPVWVHFGAGNIFRGYVAVLQDELLERGLCDRGVIAAETFDFDIVRDIYLPYDNHTLVVTLCADGTTRRFVSASVAEVLAVRPDTPDYDRLCSVIKSPGLQMVSFTITEKGYRPGTAMNILTDLLYERYKAGGVPLALVSMDNCSRNGELLQNAVLERAKTLGDPGFDAYINERLSFPWSMIDKITPAPSPAVQETLPGPTDWSPVVTSCRTVIAPFVNAEEAQYLVIEDNFPNGRPPLEKAGVYFADRDTVCKAERMKVTACLNPLHTALAVFGCLLGYTRIYDTMQDPELRALVRRVGYDEGLPAVDHPGIFEPKDFLDEVFNHRLVNPFMPDTPQRIASDTGLKIPFRFGETIKTYLSRADLSVDRLVGIPLVLAGWLRYLLEVDDNGNPMTVSPDPFLPELRTALSGVKLSEPDTAAKARAVFADSRFFGCDLYEAGLGSRCEEYLAMMLAGPGAVRAALKKMIQ